MVMSLFQMCHFLGDQSVAANQNSLSMRHKVLCSAFACLLSAVSVSIGIAEEIKIGAWNIEWLGFPEKRAKPGKDRAQEPEDLAAYIHASGVDVLSLEEIGVDSDKAPWKSKELDRVFEQLKKKHNQEWSYVLFSKADYPADTEDFIKRGQHTGLAWRSDKAKMVGSPYETPVGTNSEYGIKYWERRATAVKLSFGESKTDVVFVPIHLKSNRNDSNPSDKDYTKKQRLAEASSFVKQLSALKAHFKDEDIVVLGDTNFLAPEDETPKILTDAGFTDLNADDRGTTAAWGEGYSSAPFDRIFVTNGQPEFAKSKQTIHSTKSGSDNDIKDFRRRLSDHYLISCEISVGQDDD